MRTVFVSALALCGAVCGQTAVDSYVATQGPIAKAGLLANIGPSGAKASGAKAGVVIASPSTENPNYLFSWIRDASFGDYIKAQTTLQQVSNPSGTVTTGGLGEPKFNIDLTAFTEPWGRPQRDGPALRATALITYSNWLLKNTSQSNVLSTVWPTIKLDLDYVVANWNQTGFDLWEEVSSSSFFTTAAQHRALREGATLAKALGQDASAYTTQAANALCFLQSYWNPTGGYITSNTGGGRSGIDANSVLGSIHTFDAAAGCDAATFQPCSDKALANLKVYVDSFRSIYGVNSGIAANAAVATGRYKEDVYFGGNPWYLTTMAVAEQLYDALIVWKSQGSLQVTSTSRAFFRQFLSSVTVGTYASSTSTYTTLTTAIRKFAEDTIAVHAKYTPKDGALAEQFERSSGTPLSAADLTWSYAAALTAFDARKGVVPVSWGAKGVAVPSVCQRGPAAPSATVTFNVVAETVLGENIYLTGSVDALKGWSQENALILDPKNYPTWTITVTVPSNANIEYKYIRKNNGVVTWESDPNMSFTSPGVNQTTVLNDTWR
ncbi:Glucoamylase [Mycena kentingensis (nom. inval.)]|nr:Glucoamylase [Mycena kentingensis (nom. inval.)]